MNRQKADWQDALINLITDPSVLLDELCLDKDLLPAAYKAAELFPLRVTRSFMARMKVGDINDPLLRQVLPLGEEMVNKEGYIPDPLLETQFNPIPGLLHKYHGRVLVMLTAACAVHCRYCFRREFPYQQNNPGRHGWENIINYLAKDPTIEEVILSGGDPLAVGDNILHAFSEQLVKVSHIKRLRIHSRIPVVLPERITADFLAWVKGLQQQLVLVIHANHPQEIDLSVKEALAKLRDANVTLLNQSVLLKGINDDEQILCELSNRLFAANVLPYYLHVLDKTKGTAHFDLAYVRAQEIHKQLQKLLPGYLVPKLVREDPEQSSKTLLI